MAERPGEQALVPATNENTETTRIIYLKMMRQTLYCAHSNVAMGLGWRAAGCFTMLWSEYCSGRGQSYERPRELWRDDRSNEGP